jgi:hypothetical protein
LLYEPTLRLRALADRDDGLHHLENLHYLFGLAEAEDWPAQVVPIDSTPGAADARPPHAALFTPKVPRRL